MKRTVLYLRASSRDQIQHGFSIPDQLARLRSEARAANERIVAEFIDQARSGTSTAKRSDYQNLLAAARRREFDRVRVESVDRGHRNDTERRQFEAEMATLGIDVVYSGEPEKQAPQFRKLQRGIKGVLAEWESDETSQRTINDSAIGRKRACGVVGLFRMEFAPINRAGSKLIQKPTRS